MLLKLVSKQEKSSLVSSVFFLIFKDTTTPGDIPKAEYPTFSVGGFSKVNGE